MDFFSSQNKILREFIAISSWQSLLVVATFLALQIGIWIFLKKIKLQFMWRIIIGMLVGLLFGIVVQAAAGFPTQAEMGGLWNDCSDEDPSKWIIVETKYRWMLEANIWVSFFKNVFISGVMMLSIPIVFIAIFRVTSKPGQRGLGKIATKGVALMLFNVAIAFTLTFALGVAFNVGGGQELNPDVAVESGTVPFPQLISNYIPSNMVSALAATSIIPVMVIAALIGISVKLLSKRNGEQMEKIRGGFEVTWKVIISMMMNFMKIMPIAVMAMLASSVLSRPISELATIGKVIGIGYLGIVICIAILTLEIFISGVSVKGWWKSAWVPLVQGFATQSSNATLPVTLTTTKDSMKVDDKVVSTIGSMSTTLGLMACAGVQAGLTTSLLWTGAGEGVLGMSIVPFFFMGLIITVIASLGIAGVPGTAGVVTIGVLGGMGFGTFITPVMSIIAPLDGIFDMGRTGTNVLGAVAVIPIVAKSEGLLLDDSPLLTKKGIAKQRYIRNLKESKYEIHDELAIKLKEKDKIVFGKEFSKEEKKNAKSEFIVYKNQQKDKLNEMKVKEKESLHNEIETLQLESSSSLSEKNIAKQKYNTTLQESNDEINNEIAIKLKEKDKIVFGKEFSKEEKKTAKSEFVLYKNEQKVKFTNVKEKAKETLNAEIEDIRKKNNK